MLRVVAVLALMASVAVNWRLYASPRLYPPIELIEFNYGSFPLPTVLLIISALCLLGSLFLRWFRLLMATGMLCIIVLVLLDLHRLQYWTYLYLFILLILAFYNGRVDDPNRFTSYFILIQVIVCSFYLFSGVNQLQQNFRDQLLPEIFSALSNHLSERQYKLAIALGSAIPFVLMFTAVALFVAPLRYLGLTLAVLIHVSLLLLGFPLRKGDIAGYILHPAMLAAVILLFSGKTKQRYFSPTIILQRPLFYLVTAAFLIMPFFNSTGKWPDSLSWNVYSGNHDKLSITFPVNLYLALPKQVKFYCYPANGRIYLDHQAWCRAELGIRSDNSLLAAATLRRQLIRWNHADAPKLRLEWTPKKRLLSKQ